MSPSTLRRYRAERLLRAEFAAMRAEVTGRVRRRLRARGVHLDGGDLEACYAQAWQGLYAAVAAGEPIANPGGWLTIVTFRRALDEHRGARARGFAAPAAGGRHRPARADGAPDPAAGGAPPPPADPDLAATLDDRARLRHLFEALRARLTPRECEAATLCYLQGLTRAQAAARMGLSPARMTKLMEGRGPDRPGVAAKVGELVAAVGGGEWCERQGSLMRGFAFGVLDPRGERYRLARLHQRECPACRAYVLALRGLAAVLPPLPSPWGLGPAGAHRAGAHRPLPHRPLPHRPLLHRPLRVPRARPAHASGPRAGAGVKAGAGAKAGAGGGTVAGMGGAGTGGVAGASTGVAGAAGAGGAGGGWLLGGVGAKVAVGCVLALSVGCVAVTVAPHGVPRRAHRHGAPRAAGVHLGPVPSAAMATTLPAAASPNGAQMTTGRAPAQASAAAVARATAARRAQREFGPEQPGATTATTGSAHPAPAVAQAASVGRGDAGRLAADGAASAAVSTPRPASAPDAAPGRAEREFGPE